MKKKLKHFYRVFGALLTFIVVFNFFIGASDPTITYDSIEELQSDFPDYYYFDAGLEFNDCCVLKHINNKGCFSSEKDYYSCYAISYLYHFKDEINRELKIICYFRESLTEVQNRSHKNQSYEVVLFDEIEGIFYSDCRLVITENNQYYICQLSIYFELENILYSISINLSGIEQKEELISYFLSIAESAIISRHKGEVKLHEK